MSGQTAPTRENSVPAIWGAAAAGSPLDIVVFSKDRACQLDALLRSLCAFLPFPHRITVVFYHRWPRGLNPASTASAAKAPCSV